MTNVARAPQGGVRRASSAGAGGALGTALTAFLIQQGLPAEAAAALGAVLVGAIGALGKWARDRFAEGDRNPAIYMLSAIG